MKKNIIYLYLFNLTDYAMKKKSDVAKHYVNKRKKKNYDVKKKQDV